MLNIKIFLITYLLLNFKLIKFHIVYTPLWIIQMEPMYYIYLLKEDLLSKKDKLCNISEKGMLPLLIYY